ncbi:MAG: hypothetical protein WCA08_24820 [Desulfoferrobacter sp.]
MSKLTHVGWDVERDRLVRMVCLRNQMMVANAENIVSLLFHIIDGKSL